MQYTLTITCRTEAELADITSRLTAVALAPEASAETAPDAPVMAPQEAPAAETDKHPAPAEPAAEGPSAAAAVTKAEVQAAARKLVVAGRKEAVQAVFQKHGARLLSQIKPGDYPAVLAELAALDTEGKADAPA